MEFQASHIQGQLGVQVHEEIVEEMENLEIREWMEQMEIRDQMDFLEKMVVMASLAKLGMRGNVVIMV
jgi:Mg/Co/Ni transporter MgtE